MLHVISDTYFGRQSASLIKEFWTLCILLMTDSETVMAKNNLIFEYWTYTLFVGLENCCGDLDLKFC